MIEIRRVSGRSGDVAGGHYFTFRLPPYATSPLHVLLTSSNACNKSMHPIAQKILVVGGNGFVGIHSHALKRFASTHTTFRIGRV